MVIDTGLYCTRHETVDASFCCDRCGDPFCLECRCELLGGAICCTECAVEMAGESRGEFGAHREAAYPEVIGTAKKRRRGRFLIIVLLICFPVLVGELLFLHRSTAVDAGPDAVTRRVMGDTLVLITVLNRYKAEQGQYPERLDLIVPSHWDAGDTAELGSYEYRRVGTTRFVLQPLLTGNKEEDAGIVQAQALIPRSFGEESGLDVFFKLEQRERDTAAQGGGE